MNSEESVSAPSRWLTALEVRAVAERAAMRATTPLLRRLPSGDGHPVLVLPGFTADDRSTALLRDLLDDLGYRTHGWGLGSNIGPTSEIAAGLRDLSADLARKESQPVSVIGWSLGGIYGRELARRRPETVRQVITLGSPIQMVPGDRSAATGLWDSLRHLHDTTIGDRSVREADRPVLAVPTTSIYTRTDGIVHWRTCLVRPGPISENVEVHGSHCGLGFNPAVAFVIADRLAQRADRWRPFRPPLWMRGAFPFPARVQSQSSPEAA